MRVLTDSAPWHRRTVHRWQVLRYLSTRSLLPLYAAVFCLFAIFGVYVNLMAPYRLPLSAVLALGAASGIYSILYPWILIRHANVWLWITSAMHGVIIWAAFWALFKGWYDHLPGPPTSLATSGIVLWVLVMLSYSLFFGFIRKQATEAIRMQNELDLAHGIQQTLVPLIHRIGPLYEVYGLTRPSERVGGDLVDLIPSQDGDIAYVADVAGHGLQAGILMGMLKAAARTALLEPSSASERLPLLLDRLDNVLPSVKESHMYAAFAALQLGPQGRVRHALAGHPPVLHYCHANRTFCELSFVQFPLGLVPDAQFVAMEINVEPGDLLLIATDGILETSNAQDREFGNSGLETCVAVNASVPLPQLAGFILNAVAAWGKQQDDQTLLIVRCLAHR
jgi:serine phosphatase RsbU (regulator of sigma subunit)